MPQLQNPDLDLATLMRFGMPVERATASIVAGGTIHLFRTYVGRVALGLILGEVTTIIQTQACTAKLTATPDVGTAVDLCATSDITGKEVGSLFTISGLAATALVMALAGGVGGQPNPVVLRPGYLDLILGATNTGSVKWQVRWMPIDVGAYIAAV
jgi:hypothetical protein